MTDDTINVQVNSFDIENTKKESSFTSTGDKLLYHEKAIEDLRWKKNHPIVLHIMPTEICNLRCVFCSVAQRGEEGKLLPDLTMDQIKSVVTEFKKMGLKAVILSGGGEPSVYRHINELLEYLHSEGLEIGMISNGVVLSNKVDEDKLKYLTWLRISINALDYVPDIKIPKLDSEKTTLGFSYIWNPLSSEEVINKIKNKVQEISTTNKVEYIRLLPDCNLETGELEAAHEKLRKITKRLGAPFFHQYKTHITPKECHLGRVHPVLYVDGYVYPCDSLVLNSPADDKKFHREFALCKWDEVEEFYSQKINGTLINTEKCHNCVFSRQNELLSKIINTKDELPKPNKDLKHKNFI
ncbi:MAG: radical SAM protein [Candidatus Magasanikbacteria bacterium]|nr:radical SAM protein [Candidatus Magasanikbacteria bacterium]